MKTRKTIVLLFLLFTFLPFISQKDVSYGAFKHPALDYARFYARVYLVPAIRIETIPTSKFGTGFFTKLKQAPGKVILITNKHILEGAKELRLGIPIGDTLLIIKNTSTINVPLFKDTIKQYFVPEEDLDFALVVLDKRLYTELDTAGYYSLPDSAYTDMKNLFVGQPVVFTGYPLDLRVNEILPLLRRGMIAGIDTMKNIIYLDADAFGGSSGSPVFIDFSIQSNVEFFNTYNQMLVGIISGYKPFVKQLLNKETNKVEMIQTENSGIAVVVPAEIIRKMAERYLSGSK